MSITLKTIGDLLDIGMSLNGWCSTCGTGRPVNLAALAARYGRHASYLKPDSPIRLRCRDCDPVPTTSSRLRATTALEDDGSLEHDASNVDYG